MEFSSSAEKLLYSVLSKFIPKETFDMLQPANIRKGMEAVQTSIADYERRQQAVLNNQQAIMEALSVGHCYDNGNPNTTSNGTLALGSVGGGGCSCGRGGDCTCGNTNRVRAA